MLWIVGLLIATTLVATAIAFVRLRAAKRAVAGCRHWKPTEGQVVASSLREEWTEDTGTHYTPNVEYRYAVDGVQYANNIVTVGVEVRYSRRSGAERRLAGYAAGQPVKVLFDPRDPSNSVLECRAPYIALLWVLIATAWIILIVILALLLVPGVDGPEPILRLGMGT